jgi:hypothetical protein
MTINSVSSLNTYQRASQSQSIQKTESTQEPQRLQKKDGSGQGKRLNRMQADSKMTQNYNYSKDITNSNYRIGSNLDISI